MALPPDFPQVPVPPQPSVALLDPKTGLISADWYAFLQALARFNKAVRARLDSST